MERIFTLLFLIISCSLYAQTVHRVINGMDLQTIIDNANSGDVILVEGGNYENININKVVHIYGTGYFIDGLVYNPNQQATTSTSIVGNIEFNANGASINGLTANNLNVKANQISIIKAKFLNANIGTESQPVNNILISKSIFGDFTFHPHSSNCLLKNNILQNGNISTGVNATFKNNTFRGGAIHDVQGNNNIFINNIFPNVFVEKNCYEPSSSFFIYRNTQNQFINNIWGEARDSQCAYRWVNIEVNPTNKTMQDYTVMFLTAENLPEDARYQLAPNSPARGAGEGGTDAGAFGGDDPYVLSGIPDIPSIYYLNVQPSVPQGGTLQVQIKAKTNN